MRKELWSRMDLTCRMGQMREIRQICGVGLGRGEQGWSEFELMNFRQLKVILVIDLIMNFHKSGKSPAIKSVSKNKHKRKQTVSACKNLNPDYYIHLEQKKKTKKPKLDLLYGNYSSQKKLRSITQNQPQPPQELYSQHTKRKLKREICIVLGAQRTRSSTLLNGGKMEVPLRPSRKSEMDRIYSRTREVLEKYEEQIVRLHERNKELQEQNKRLKTYQSQK